MFRVRSSCAKCWSFKRKHAFLMVSPVRNKSFHWAEICLCPPSPPTLSPHASGHSALYPRSGRPLGFRAKWGRVVTVCTGEVSDYMFYVPVWSCLSIYTELTHYFITFLQFLFYLGHYYWCLNLPPFWMEKHIVVRSYNGILLGNQKEWPIGTHNNMGKFPK